MKKIILLSDGTGNSSSSPQKTNVWRTYWALDLSDKSSQIAYYDNGVGTSGFIPTAILGLGFGYGLSRNVKDIYGFLCRTYKPGDEIYGFGFSRGAFTIRTVMDLIASQGIVDPAMAKDERDLDRLVNAAYEEFRKKHYNPSFFALFTRPLRDVATKGWCKVTGKRFYNSEKNIRYKDGPDDAPLIKFVGVWDTVAAYGFPIDELARAWDRIVWPLVPKTRDLSSRIGCARHALSLDEQRESFHPMLWNEEPKLLESGQLQQVWFSGVHANVGGGYPDDTLSFVPLNWILKQSEQNDGLAYLPQQREHYISMADVNGPMSDSRSGLGNMYRYGPRNVGWLYHNQNTGIFNWCKRKFQSTKEPEVKAFTTNPQIHQSVFDRVVQAGDSYAPINVPGRYEVVDCAVQPSASELANKPGKETEEESTRRFDQQRYIWNKVSGRQYLYYGTLSAMLYFIVFPFIIYSSESKETLDVAVHDYLEPVLGVFSYLIRAIPHLLGEVSGVSMVKSWTSKYEGYPFVFTFGIISIAFLLVWSSKIKKSIKSESRRNWFHLIERNIVPPIGPSAFRRSLTYIFTSQIYRFLIKLIRFAVETITTLFLLAIVSMFILRFVFSTVDGSGGVCSAKLPTESRQFGQSFVFDPTDACFATGLNLDRHQNYRIQIELSEDWEDGNHIDDIAEDATGLDILPMASYFLLPIRRQLLVDWHQMVARVDNKLFDVQELPVNPKDPMLQGEKNFAFDIQTRRSGQLYLYVNEVVYPEVCNLFL